MPTQFASKKQQTQVLEERLNRWCSNAKHFQRLRFLKVAGGANSATGRPSGVMIRV